MANIRTRGQLRSEIITLGDLTLDAFITAASIDRQIDRSREDLYDMVLDQAPQWATRHTDVTTVAGVATINLPEDFYQLVGVGWKCGDRFEDMGELDFARRNDYQDNDWAHTVAPVWRELRGGKLEIFPTPRGRFVVRLWWIPTLDRLVSDEEDIDFPGGWDRWIVYDCVQFFKTKNEDDLTEVMLKKTELARRVVRAAKKRKRSPMKVRDVRRRRRVQAGCATDTGLATAPGPTPPLNLLLLEDGTPILLEDTDTIELEP